MTPSSRKMPHEVCLPTCRRLFPKCTTHGGNFSMLKYQKYFRNQAQEIYLIKEMSLETKTNTTSAQQSKSIKRSSKPFNNCGIVEKTADQSACYNWSMSSKFLNHRFSMFRDRGDDVTPSRQSEGTRKFSFLNYSTLLRKRETPMYITWAPLFWIWSWKVQNFSSFHRHVVFASNGREIFYAGRFQKRSRLIKVPCLCRVILFYLAIRLIKFAFASDESGWDPFFWFFAEAILLQRSQCWLVYGLRLV